MVRGALLWGAVGAVAGAALALAVRGSDAAFSVGLAAAIVLANAGLAAMISAVAGRVSAVAAAMVSLPSFAVRMMLIFLTLAWLQGVPAVDRPAFAVAFAVGVMTVIALEARTWKRTPWLATTFGTVRTETEDES